MNRTSIVLIGNGTAAVRVLRELRTLGVIVPLVLADPKDTGADTWRLSLAGEAMRVGYRMGRDLFTPKDPNASEMMNAIHDAEADVILSIQCARILRRPLMGLARQGIINLHNAPLPLLRGCDPFAWAIHDGLLEMGVTLHQIADEGIDNGPVLAQRRWPIAADASAWDLYVRGVEEGAMLVRDSVSAVASGKIPPVPQDSRYVTYHPMGQFPFCDLEIQWDRVAATLGAWIRARIFPPFQTPYFVVSGRRVDVLRCRMRDERGIPGTVLSLAPLCIAARWGSIEITEARCEGSELSGADVAQIFGSSPGRAVSLA